MSVLDSFGGGNVWSLGELEFTSSINDILEKDNFTLDELLREPELLQEVKSKNEKLIEFLSSDDVIKQLLKYISVEASNDDDDYRKYKYPYMSCEIICFEIPSVLDKVVDTQDERYLKLLFEPILQNRKLNNYLAGYFEKMLEVLFRCKTVNMMRYMNEGGLNFLNKFLAHIDNYSIMQIIQRLLLPHIPFYSDALIEELNDEDRLKLQCLWSYDINTSKYLIDTMINANKYEVSMHVADLLITVIQLSPSDAPILKYLSDATICHSLCQVIEKSVNESINQLFSLEVAVASVLECLLSRIHETVLSIFLNSNSAYNEKRTKEQIDADHNLYLNLKDCIQNILQNISIILPKIADSIYLEINDHSLKIVNQTKQPNKTLRQRTFYYTKLIESLCRLGDSFIDDGLVISGILQTIVKLFLLHPYHSMFHLSVQRIAVAILDDFMNRKNICTHLLVECDFFKIIQSELTTAIDIPISSRKPYIGHLLILALVLDSLIGIATPNNVDIDIESLETTTKDNETTTKSGFREYYDNILDLHSWDTFSGDVLNKLSVAATQSINTEILDSPVSINSHMFYF